MFECFSADESPYSEKYIKLDFSQNLSIRPKLEVQSAHFSNKQYTLHCAIAKPFDKQYHYHLSNDNKHDGIFVEHVLRDLIIFTVQSQSHLTSNIIIT